MMQDFFVWSSIKCLGIKDLKLTENVFLCYCFCSLKISLFESKCMCIFLFIFPSQPTLQFIYISLSFHWDTSKERLIAEAREDKVNFFINIFMAILFFPKPSIQIFTKDQCPFNRIICNIMSLTQLVEFTTSFPLSSTLGLEASLKATFSVSSFFGQVLYTDT